MSLFEEVQKIVGETLNVQPDTITLETSQESLSTWDSLAQINLITAIEAQYDVEFEVEEIAEVASVQAIVDYLKNAGAG